MCPTFEVDFGGVQAVTPIYKKGLYELTIARVFGAAWEKLDKETGTTTTVRKVTVRPKMVGVYDSRGKLKTELDGKDIKDKEAEDISLWLHSEGGVKQSKLACMAFFGYTKEEEAKFNEFFATLDLGFSAEEKDDGGYQVTLGDGWKSLEGKNFRADLSEGINEYEGKKTPEQNYDNFYPVGR